jgi:hypothetical protein
VYGSDAATAAALRTGSKGLLKTTLLNGLELPPLNSGNISNSNDAHVVSDTLLYLVGDVRGNENPALTSLHIVFLREHNRRAKQLALEHPDWQDEDLYQEARRWVAALIQHITFNEYYPITIGDAPPDYEGYNASIDPSMYTEFSTGAFRYGHSEVSQWIWRVDANGNEIPEKHLPLMASYFNSPTTIGQVGVEPILRGMVSFLQNAVDLYFVDDLRNFLFGSPDKGGFDLAAINIQRGRDHGLPGFNDFRKAYGLEPYTKWSDIHPDPAVNSLLASVYTSIDDCDVYVCGLAEYHAITDQANVGPTFVVSIMDQYLRLRDGDRFWFENNQWNDTELTEIKSTLLSDIIVRNTPIQRNELQCFVFALPDGCGKPVQRSTKSYDFVITLGLKTKAHPYYGMGSPWGFSLNGVEGGNFTVERLKRYSFLIQSTCAHSFVITYSYPAGLTPPANPPVYNGGMPVAGDGDLFAALTNGFTCLHQLEGETYLFVDADTPDEIYYQCDFHPLMGGSIKVTGDKAGGGVISGASSLFTLAVTIPLVAALMLLFN